jgi:hypothetical protein
LSRNIGSVDAGDGVLGADGGGGCAGLNVFDVWGAEGLAGPGGFLGGMTGSQVTGSRSVERLAAQLAELDADPAQPARG